MSEQDQGPGRPPGSVIDTPYKRAEALRNESNRLGDDIVHAHLAPLAGWPPPRLPAAAKPERVAKEDMDTALKQPLDLCKIDTIEDVGRALADIVAAVANGKLSPRDGVLISKIVEARRKAFESIDFKKEIDDLKRDNGDD